MTSEQAQIISMIDPIQWKTLCDIIDYERDLLLKMLDDPGNPRDKDLFFKGGRAFGLQVKGYKEQGWKMLHPMTEEQEIKESQKENL